MRLAPENYPNKIKRRAPARTLGHSRQSGFAYLLALFLAVVLIITSQEVLESYATRGRRVREQEAIWRGEQVERGIRLYYHKTGHYPQTFDDLQNGLPELHFLREAAMKNPMNQTDGKWRFIYVNAAGQIIGSVKYATLQQMAIMDLNHGKIPPVTPGAVSASSLAAGSNALGSSSPGSSGLGTSGLGSNLSTQSGLQFGGSSALGASSTSGAASSSSDSGQLENPLAALKPTGPVDGPVPGAFLTGVGGVTETKSLIVYHGGKKYLDWEFIWNPIEDQARAMQAQGNGAQGGLLPGMTNLPGLPTGLTGTSPAGAAGTSATPGTSPTAPAQTANPAPQPNPNTPGQNSDQ